MRHYYLPIYCVAILAVTATTMLSPRVVEAQGSDQFEIEEIIVTARRRSERLQDVPGTVTVLTASVIESAGIRRPEHFIALTPGVTMVNAAEVGDTQVNIRGINGARDAETSFAYAPACTCTLTTQRVPPSFSAAATASSAVSTA